MISLQEALAAYPRSLQPLGTENIPTLEAMNRCLAESPRAQVDLPRFTQSAMDGYALAAQDTTPASTERPLRLPIAGSLPAGPLDELPQLRRGTAWRILTGGSLPRGADTVIPQELVQTDENHIVLASVYDADRNVRHAGEELRAGATLATIGQRISPGLLGALVMAGVATVSVYRRPRVHVLVTGDEIRPLGSALRGGEIFDSNGPLVGGLLRAMGYPPPEVAHVRDTGGEVRAALGQAIETADLVITTGGVSVGDRDFIPAVAAELGVEKIFWKVAQKPAKPLFFGIRHHTALLGLPGNPGAVLVGMLLHVRHALDCLEGAVPAGAPFHYGRLAAKERADERRDRLVRMNLETSPAGAVLLHPLGKQDSHMLSNLSTARALVHLPAAASDYPADTVVRWTPLGGTCSI
jgi:molybdopterin molybdotransferase